MKHYIEPKMNIFTGVLGKAIAQGILNGSVDEQLGKGRNRDFEESDKSRSDNGWTDGLW